MHTQRTHMHTSSHTCKHTHTQTRTNTNTNTPDTPHTHLPSALATLFCSLSDLPPSSPTPSPTPCHCSHSHFDPKTTRKFFDKPTNHARMEKQSTICTHELTSPIFGTKHPKNQESNSLPFKKPTGFLKWLFSFEGVRSFVRHSFGPGAQQLRTQTYTHTHTYIHTHTHTHTHTHAHTTHYTV